MVLKWFLIAFFTVEALYAIVIVDKSRDPIRGGVAAAVVLTYAAIIACILIGWPK